MSQLPEPAPEAAQHSQTLSALIRQAIAADGGWISFARFMELALYAPGLGYYSAGAAKFGDSGDFVTAPEISSLFGRTLARQAAQVLRLTRGDMLEIGAGSGRLALQLLLELEAMDMLPEHYHVLEVSADLQERQRAFIQARAPRFLERMAWLEQLPSSFTGLILGNEVLDAMPVHLVAWRHDGLYERGVIAGKNGFVWRERPLTDDALFRAARRLPVSPEYLSEVSLAVPAFVNSLAQILRQGAVLMIDYGFGESEYYHPQRAEGTLMCHYRHQAHGDPFYLPGLQDITAHVDFSAVAAAAAESRLDLLGYTTQSSFLINCGIAELLGETSPEDVSAYFPLVSQAQRLLSPAEMGELFKVIALGKGISEPLSGFAAGDKSRML
jgi:SAM-dependent MidA family methyltransferase